MNRKMNVAPPFARAYSSDAIRNEEQRVPNTCKELFDRADKDAERRNELVLKMFETFFQKQRKEFAAMRYENKVNLVKHGIDVVLPIVVFTGAAGWYTLCWLETYVGKKIDYLKATPARWGTAAVDTVASGADSILSGAAMGVNSVTYGTTVLVNGAITMLSNIWEKTSELFVWKKGEEAEQLKVQEAEFTEEQLKNEEEDFQRVVSFHVDKDRLVVPLPVEEPLDDDDEEVLYTRFLWPVWEE